MLGQQRLGSARRWHDHDALCASDRQGRDRQLKRPLRGTAIASGYQHTCALLVSGTQKCWGVNNIGTLGDGTMQTGLPPNIRLAPVTVIAAEGIASPLTGIGQRAIVAGFGQSCVLLVNGTVKCWGANLSGEVGDGTTSQRSTPVIVKVAGGAPLSNVVAVAAGGFYTCALLSNGTVQYVLG